MPLPEVPPRLAAQQLAFAAHLRDPEHAPPPPGIEDRRMAVYRDLFYNSLESILAGNFPVLRGLRGDAWWHRLVRDFYRQHRARTPLFPEIAREFLHWLQERPPVGDDMPPFLLELAHYEWVELALAIAEPEPLAPDCDPDGELLDGAPVLSPLAWPLAYRYPVQRISADFQPVEAPPQPTFLLVAREADDRVRFREIDLAGFRLLQAVAGNDEAQGGRALLLALAREAGVTDLEPFVRMGATLLAQLRERQVIAGARPARPASGADDPATVDPPAAPA
jgi:uncharacterized protein